MRVERVDQLHLLVQVAAVDLDVARLVDDLGGGVELRVDVGHRLHDLGRADQRALLAVHELAEAPGLGVAAQLALALVGHGRPTTRCRRSGMISSGMPTGLVEVDLLAPVEPVAADPLAPRALVVEAQQLVPPTRVVEVEHGGRRGLDAPLRVEGEVRVGDGRAGGHEAPLGHFQRQLSASSATRRYPVRHRGRRLPVRRTVSRTPGQPALESHRSRAAQRKSKATLMAPLSSWLARTVKASRQSSSRKVWVSMPVMSIRPSDARRR